VHFYGTDCRSPILGILAGNLWKVDASDQESELLSCQKMAQPHAARAALALIRRDFQAAFVGAETPGKATDNPAD
jgi:hypothetical protein